MENFCTTREVHCTGRPCLRRFFFSRRGREAKENNIFFVAHSSTKLSYALAEGPLGLRRLAARGR